MVPFAMKKCWGSPWLGALVVNPLVFTAPWVLLSLLLAALPGNAPEYVAWGLVTILLGAFAGFVRTAITAAQRGWAEGVALLSVGLVASGVVGFLAVWAWSRIAEFTCEERSICFFT